MSDDELEQAAMAPRRWIRLCATLGKKHPRAELQPTATRIIQDPLDGSDKSMERIEAFIVPGGRYVVSKSLCGIGIWDLWFTYAVLPNKVVWCERHGDRIIFRVWDYQLNHSINFTADFEIEKLGYGIQVNLNLFKSSFFYFLAY
jgi:hypothetical protein